jgi:hypothetical protein
MNRNPTGKTARKTVGRSFQRGIDSRRGCGKKGRSGRKPDWLKRQADDLLSDPGSWSQVERILKNADHPLFGMMWGKLADRAHGKPKESVELTGQDRAPIIVRFVDEGSRRTAR